jgi:hypothetical protein
MHISAVLSHVSHQGYQHHEAGCLGLKLHTQTLSDPTFLKPHATTRRLNIQI